MDRLGAAVAALSASLSDYQALVSGVAGEDDVRAAQAGLRQVLDHFVQCAEEDTDWGNPFEGAEGSSGGWGGAGGHRLVADYRITVGQSRKLMKRAHQVAEAPDACVPMRVETVSDAVFALMANAQQDVVQQFRDAGVVAEFELRTG
ncbi:hypothetical protein Lesp02_61490 [Lentzea sp. NBRC 105346]|uniref:hypothetical protein n=1 Tax=Lentzea sp. NBRC 105346 TaxID=3032205 RepID=UPI002555DC84|nr:hypothetical protein [Lentzea sp. NBRC 105346]GLZ33961.1 hypothetical protein Lesp02_61490 [Lentzea sp. NBRC 105346]